MTWVTMAIRMQSNTSVGGKEAMTSMVFRERRYINATAQPKTAASARLRNK
jgi:hypothetical protein